MNKLAFICVAFILLMQACDCEINPGPDSSLSVNENDSCSKFPCLYCHNPCRWDHTAVQCDECQGWIHTNCLGMNTAQYEILGNSNISWTCCSCGMPNFSTSLFSHWSLEMSNSFSSLSSASTGHDDTPLSPPVATSSPKDTAPPTGLTGGKRNTGTNLKKKNRQANVSIKVMVINFESIKNKVASLAAFLEIQDYPDVIIGTETWLNPSVGSSELFPPCYTVIRKDRQDSYGGVLQCSKIINYSNITW